LALILFHSTNKNSGQYTGSFPKLCEPSCYELRGSCNYDSGTCNCNNGYAPLTTGFFSFLFFSFENKLEK